MKNVKRNLKRNALQVLALSSLFSLVACNNYTTQPLCNSENATTLPGIEGTYTFTFQDEKFVTHTSEVIIETSDLAKGKLAVRSLVSSNLPQMIEDGEGALCHLDGRTILQTTQKDGLGYAYAALTRSPESLSYQAVVFDRAALDILDIDWKVVEVASPSWVAKSPFADGEGQQTALVVSNENVSWRTLWQSAKILPISLSLLKK